MTNKPFKLKVKTGENNGKSYWDTCGVAFLNTDDNGNITSISVRHNMFPNVDMVAFPQRAKDDQNVTEQP